MPHAPTSLTSRASINGHPIHPMLIAFPIAFLLGALASDAGFWWTSDPFWARASLWLAGAGLVTGLLAAVFGLIDFLAIPPVRSMPSAWVHFLGNATALLLTLWSVLHRLDDPVAAVLPLGIILSAIVAAILGVTGWLGGELSYRHRVAVIGATAEKGHEHAGDDYALHPRR